MNGVELAHSVLNEINFVSHTLHFTARCSFSPDTRSSKQILGSIGIIFLLAVLLTIGELVAMYSHYAAIVDARLADRSLVQPTGIYAAPGRVSLDQHLTQAGLIERLLRIGYREGEDTNEFSAGSFSVYQGCVELRSNEFGSRSNLPAWVGSTITQQLIKVRQFLSEEN